MHADDGLDRTPGAPICTVPTEHWRRVTTDASPAVEVRLWAVDQHADAALGPDAARVGMVVWPSVAHASPPDVLARLPRLTVVQAMTAGTEHLRRVVPPGVTVCSAAPALAASTAELCLSLILASQRELPRAWDQARREIWSEYPCRSLADRRVLLIGVGGIGSAITERLRPFEVQLTRVGRTPRQDAVGRVFGWREIGALLPEHDIVVLATPLTSETTGLVDREFLRLMRDQALLVNVGRGGLVRTEDLVPELTSGRLRAALDVVDPEPLPPGHPLWKAPRTILTPHVGGTSTAVDERVESTLRAQIVRFAGSAPLLNQVSWDT